LARLLVQEVTEL
jgi:tRNA U34 5-methylaminomethyl-2-thiouridine-forming methyltransferase MnmC